MAFLQIEGLCKSFGGLRAIQDLDLSVDEREIVGIIGPNGSGKTTALNLVTAATPPFFLQHGTRDATVPAQQSIEFAEALRRVLGDEKVRLELVDDAVHLDPKFLTAENIDRVFGFLDGCFHRS